MTRDEHRIPGRRSGLAHLASPNIRGKIVLPYLILTVVVAIVGVYVVTRLVFSSLDERLTNQLLEAGRTVSNTLARQELDHLESARAIAYTEGLADALVRGDVERVFALAQPMAAVSGMENVVVTDASGREVLHLLRQGDGTYLAIPGQPGSSGLWMVQALIEAGDPNALPRRGLGLHMTDQRYYYLTATSIPLDDSLAGVVVVGTSLDTLLPRLQTSSLAHVTIYVEGGQAIASTFALGEDPAEVASLLDELAVTPETYETALYNTESTIVENVEIQENVQIYGYPYRLAHGPFRVGGDSLGVFGVALPSNFLVQAGATNRITYAAVFFALMVAVVIIGYLVSQRITSPLGRLVRTSQAVAEGDLNQRTGIASGDEIGILAATFDEMTGRLAERTRALEEALGRMRAILSSIGDGVLLEDLDKNLIPLNAAAEAMMEEMSENFLLGPLREMSVSEQDKSLDPEEATPWVLERRRFEVSKKVVSAHSAAVRTEDGKFLGTVIVLRDVTAEAETERLKDAFVAHVSHELRTPLTAIKGYIELVLAGATGTLTDEQRSSMETIHRHTENLVAMINALLDFSEIEAWSRLTIQRHPVFLSELVEEVAEEWTSRMGEKDLVFEVDIAKDLPMVNADDRRLRWAFINLVRNAWQYTPEGGSVSLKLYRDDGNVVLDVADTGIGISPNDQARIFDRFSRAGSMTYSNVRGLGLGLYVTKAIIETHGGEIHLISEEGEGSTFSVVLPAMAE